MFQRLTWLKRLQIALAIALVTFTVLLGALALRTALGEDPALGTGAQVRTVTSGSSSSSSTSSEDSSATDDSTASSDDSGWWDDLVGSDDESSDDGTSSEQRHHLLAVRSPDHLPVMTEDRRLRLMGSDVRILASPAAADEVEALLRDYDARLSRFRPDSELSALNADPRETVPASALLRDAVRTALQAARSTDGLVDPTLLDELEDAGYVDSWDASRRVPWAQARAGLPPARAARPHPARRWREIRRRRPRRDDHAPARPAHRHRRHRQGPRRRRRGACPHLRALLGGQLRRRSARRRDGRGDARRARRASARSRLAPRPAAAQRCGRDLRNRGAHLAPPRRPDRAPRDRPRQR